MIVEKKVKCLKLMGWQNTGRNWDESLIVQTVRTIELLQDEGFVQGEPWGHDLQYRLASAIGSNSDGTIRTITTMMRQMGVLAPGALRPRQVVSSSSLLSTTGRVLFRVLQMSLAAKNLSDSSLRDKLEQPLQDVQRALFARAMLNHFFPSGARGTGNRPLHPLRAVMKALRRFGYLDRMEWYLLNTYIVEDDNAEHEEQLASAIFRKRSRQLSLSMDNVVKNQKGHQYLPQQLQAAGFVDLAYSGKTWIRMTENTEYFPGLVDYVLADDFLASFYEYHQYDPPEMDVDT